MCTRLVSSLPGPRPPWSACPGPWADGLCPPQGILHFQLGRGEPMLHTRLRPHCRAFLEKVAQLYELHVFTFGSRLYAHTIAGERSPRTLRGSLSLPTMPALLSLFLPRRRFSIDL